MTSCVAVRVKIGECWWRHVTIAATPASRRRTLNGVSITFATKEITERRFPLFEGCPIAKWREQRVAGILNRRFSLDDLRAYIADQVNRMIEHASVRPEVEWGPRYRKAEASLEVGTGVSAIIAHALMREVAGRRGPILCACGRMLPPEKSRRGRPSVWCPACRADNEDLSARQRRLNAKRESLAS